MSATEKLQWLGQTKNDVFIYTASGTGAMEAAISNTINPGDKVLSLAIGVFGQRFADIAKIYGADTTVLKAESGQCISPEQLKEALSKNKFKAVTLTHSETSTGTANDIKTLLPLIKEHGALSIVDVVTSLGCMDVRMDEWGIDVMLSGSQKGFMIPPGLSFIYVSENAYKAKAQCKSPCYYFCWTQAKKALADSTTPWTPNVSHIVALELALQMMQEEGLQNILDRHTRIKNRLRNGIKDMGLKLLTKDSLASAAITAIFPPEGIAVPDIRKAFQQDHNIVVANGQKELKDKIFRMGHLGFVTDDNIEMGLNALKAVLNKLK
jgi:aspartate aminotransferase-like enzyme